MVQLLTSQFLNQFVVHHVMCLPLIIIKADLLKIHRQSSVKNHLVKIFHVIIPFIYFRGCGNSALGMDKSRPLLPNNIPFE